VRTREEFEQSHIDGAIWVDPDMSAASFAEAHGARVRGKTAVFYCAVGVRSGVMVQRVSQSLAPFGPAATVNLKGGVFRWHAQRKPLMSTAGPVRTVHPYDASWGKLLDRTLAEEGARSR
jgi:rhodanese-related sulfurtransferase